ncbi:MAG: hypothetical protein ACFFDP_03210, partial [Promethearchaeota archaeon]
SDLLTGFSDTHKWNTTLHAYGWQSDHIYIVNGELTSTVGRNALNFLINNADENDVVFFFIFAHGNWIGNEMMWSSWFPSMWMSVPSHNKLLFVSSCGAGSFSNSLTDDPVEHIHLGSVQADEYAWAGLPEEGLPIIGEVFSHYFSAAFLNDSADVNSNGEVSVEEAFSFASPQSRNYLANVVFPAYEYYAEMCGNVAPHPTMDDAYPDEMSIAVEPGDPLYNQILFQLLLVWTPVIVVCIVASIILSSLLLLRKWAII